jgi:hypothetical protein
VHARKQAILIEDPVKDGVREHRIDGLVEVELGEIRAPHRGALGGQRMAGVLDHLLRGVDRDHAPARQPLQQAPCDSPRTAARIEHGLVAAQRQAVEHILGPGLLDAGAALVGSGVPGAGAHGTFSRDIAYSDSPAASRASTRLRSNGVGQGIAEV